MQRFLSLAGLWLGLTLSGPAQAATKTVPLNPWQKLDIEGHLQVTLVHGDKSELVLTGERSVIDKVLVRQSGQKLEIRPADRFQIPQQSLTITIHTPQTPLAEIDVSEASQLTVEWAKVAGLNGEFELELSEGSSFLAPLIETAELDIEQSGASRLTIRQIKTEKAEIESSGSSNLTIGGQATKLKLTASGSSQLDMTKLNVGTVELQLSGASRCQLGEVSSLKGRASGASEITVKGQPATDLKTSGAARIRS
jgi:hypothetical protein